MNHLAPRFILTLAVAASMALTLTIQAAFGAEQKEPRRFDLSARASEIDPRAKEHPEIGFVFNDDKAKPQDVEHAVVDTRVRPKGQLVIWLMGHN